ncbi:MAG: hypothetical protein ACRERS_10340, partial [Methylococcales bacterium]
MEPIARIFALLALFVGIARNSYLWLQRQLRGFLFWFRPTFSTVSLQEIAGVFGRTSSYYFELEDRLYSGTRTTRILTLGQLCFWAIACLLFGIAYWPWSLMSRLCLRGSDKKRILLVSHESRMNGAP